MGTKRREDRLRTVSYEYVGTDKEFDSFLKLLIHDYLAVDHPGASTEGPAENVDFSAA